MPISKGRNLWTREELILVFNLYLKLPFGQLHRGRPEVKKLAHLIGRSENAVALRLVNFAACDPYLMLRGIRGMRGGIKQCQPIWDEFHNDRANLLYESECIFNDMKNMNKDGYSYLPNRYIQHKLNGSYKLRLSKHRVNQNIFRKIVLANYNNKCATTGIDIDYLLVASQRVSIK